MSKKTDEVFEINLSQVGREVFLALAFMELSSGMMH